jgi:uncharacterized membrane protein
MQRVFDNRLAAGSKKRRSVSGGARRVALALLSCCYAVLWVGGVARGWRGDFDAAGQSWLAALFLTVAGVIVLVGTRKRGERLTLLSVAALGFAAEVLGVHWGVPFGSYGYTNALGPKLFGVPPAVAFAWMTLAAYVKQLVARLELAPLAETFVAAAWLTALDLLIDPLAANQLGYWRWDVKGNYYGVPVTNFAGWLIVSLLVFGILRKKFERSLPARLAGVSIVLFFTLLAVGFNSSLVALSGCALLLVDCLTKIRKRREDHESF